MSAADPSARQRRRVLIVTAAGIALSLILIGLFLKSSRSPAEDRLNQAVVFLQTGRPREARTIFELIIRDFPASPQAAKAREYLGMPQPRPAVTDSPIEIRIEETQAPPRPMTPEDRLFHDAEMFYPRGAKTQEDLEQAVKRYTQFVDSFPESPRVADALYWIAQCQDHLGRSDRAVAAWKVFLRRCPGDGRVAEATFALGFIHHQALGRTAEGGKYFKQVIAKYPDSPEAEESRRILGIKSGKDEFPPPGETPTIVTAPGGM